MIGRAIIAAACLLAAVPAAAQPLRDRLPQDEVIYFLLPDRFDNGDPGNDRGGATGDRSATGYDPTDKGFYHGGDLKGVIRRLGYIQDLGATAIWIGPVFRNKWVQGPPGHQSAGYHGYWIEDFGHVDPHFGSDADFAELVAKAHARGLKVYMDIVVNHTADVIEYRGCPRGCAYRSRADYPYTRRGGVDERPINAGFAGDGDQRPANFAKLTEPDWAYPVFVPPAEAQAKSPAWLNDPIHYHNRGNSAFAGESSTMGDFFWLDDLMTEDPAVVAGMIAIYGEWIDRYAIDGFRIDTARHVNPEFWQAFVPAMQARAAARGIAHFAIFGEVADHDLRPVEQAWHTRVAKLPAVLDFAFREAVIDTVAGKRGTDAFATVFAGDALYARGFDTAVTLPTFTGNHDDGRFAMQVRRAFPQADDAQVIARVGLANAMLLTLRGVPVIYAGDEQGFVGDGGDQDAREDQFASRVPSYNDNHLLGTATTTAQPHFGTANPLFRAIAVLARIRLATPALTRGRQVVRFASDRPGLLAISRFDPTTGAEVLLAFNTSATAIRAQVQVEDASRRFRTLAGSCAGVASAPGSVAVTLPPFGYAICAAATP